MRSANRRTSIRGNLSFDLNLVSRLMSQPDVSSGGIPCCLRRCHASATVQRHRAESAAAMSSDGAAATWTATLGQLAATGHARQLRHVAARHASGLRHEDDAFVVGAQNDFATRVARHAAQGDHRAHARARRRPPRRCHVRSACVPTRSRAPVLDPPSADADPGAVPQPAASRTRAQPGADVQDFVVGDENSLAFDAAARVVEEPGTSTRC